MCNFLSREILQDKFRGALLGCFLGDAFGVGFEGMTPGKVQFHIGNLSRSFTRCYTDDTDMTLALAESLAQHGQVDPEDVAEQFSKHCDLTRGYGAGTINAILALRAGSKWDQVARVVFEKGSFGNGAAMRVSPIGLFYHDNAAALEEAALKQAMITHVHLLGQWGAVMQACSVGLAVIKSPKEPLEEEAIVHLREVLWRGPIEYVKALNKIEEMLAQRRRPGVQEVVRSLGNGVEAHLSVPSACYIALTYSPDFCAAVRAAISLGGDADTIAGMVGAIVGAHVGEKRLPAEWMEQLEEGPRGRSFARNLADQLFETWCKIHRTSSGQAVALT